MKIAPNFYLPVCNLKNFIYICKKNLDRIQTRRQSVNRL
jgi:hypothetical protein